MADDILNRNAIRLLREDWKTPGALARELYTIIADEPAAGVSTLTPVARQRAEAEAARGVLDLSPLQPPKPSAIPQSQPRPPLSASLVESVLKQQIVNQYVTGANPVGVLSMPENFAPVTFEEDELLGLPAPASVHSAATPGDQGDNETLSTPESTYRAPRDVGPTVEHAEEFVLREIEQRHRKPYALNLPVPFGDSPDSAPPGNGSFIGQALDQSQAGSNLAGGNWAGSMPTPPPGGMVQWFNLYPDNPMSPPSDDSPAPVVVLQLAQNLPANTWVSGIQTCSDGCYYVQVPVWLADASPSSGQSGSSSSTANSSSASGSS